MQLDKFLEEFPKHLAKKGWALYDTQGINQLENLAQFKDIISKGCIDKMEVETRYIITPLASQCDDVEEILEIFEITAEPVCYRLYQQYCCPIDSLILDNQGALLIIVDTLLLLKVNPQLEFLPLPELKQLPYFVIKVPILHTPVSFSTEEFVQTRFNTWRSKKCSSI